MSTRKKIAKPAVTNTSVGTIEIGEEYFLAALKPTKTGTMSLFFVLEGAAPDSEANFNMFCDAEDIVEHDIRLGDRIVFDESGTIVETQTADGTAFRHVRGGHFNRVPRQVQGTW